MNDTTGEATRPRPEEPPLEPATRRSARQYLVRWRPTAKFLARTEVHVFALSIAASVLLSFFPFLIVMLSFCEYTVRWTGAANAIYFALSDAFAGDLGEFLNRNLKEHVAAQGPVQFTSLILLLFTANGIFEPLEVALNRVWGATENRSYIKNQILSLGLILVCGGLALCSFLLTAKDHDLVRSAFHLGNVFPFWLTWFVFKLAAMPFTILALFLVYWVLPNRRVPARPLIKVAVWVGLSLEALKYVYMLVAPFVMARLAREYGPFQRSAALLMLSFAAAMIVLAGAEWSARTLE